MIRLLALVLCLGITLSSLSAANAGPLPANSVVVDEVRLVALPRTSSARAQAVAADLALRERRFADLAQMLVPERAEDPVLYEWLVAGVLQKLRVVAPIADLEPALRAIAARPSRVFRRHPETAGEWYVPVFAPDLLAAGTLELWRRETAAREWVARIKVDPSAFLAAAKSARDGADLVRALDLLDSRALSRVRAALPKAGFVAPPGFWATLALRSRDPAIFHVAFEHETPDEAMRLLQLVPRVLPRRDALAALDSLLEDEVFASAAVSGLATFARGDAELEQRLFALLADDRLGPSAASALARSDTTGRTARLASRLWSAPTEVEQRNLLLYLRLVGTPDSIAAAKTFAASPSMAPALRAEVAAW